MLQYVGLGDLTIVQQGVGGTRSQVAHDERGAQQKLLAAGLVAHAHASHPPFFVQDLLHVALQAQLGSLFNDAALQFGGQRAAAASDDAGRAVAEHILRGADHFFRADLVRVQG